MAFPIVTDLTEPPVVGAFYLVPCVRYWWRGLLRWWPVVGPKHDDAEHLDFKPAHYHIDRRFLREADFRREEPRRSEPHADRRWLSLYPADTQYAGAPLQEIAADSYKGGPLPAPVLRKRRCLVADVSFPSIARTGAKFERFHDAYQGKRCGRDAEGHLICPHKGARLGSLVPDAKGIVTCPLHGLAINTETGVVVRRPHGGPKL